MLAGFFFLVVSCPINATFIGVLTATLLARFVSIPIQAVKPSPHPSNVRHHHQTEVVCSTASVRRMSTLRPNLGNAKPPNPLPLSPITTADRPIQITHHHHHHLLMQPHRHFTIQTQLGQALDLHVASLTPRSLENVPRTIMPNNNQGLEWIRRLYTNS